VTQINPTSPKFEPNWASLQGYTIPEWYKDAKFGIFIHWGVYAVPAFGSEWYPRNMYQPGSPEFEHHVKTYGPQTEFGYKDFIPQFSAANFNPAQWAALFKEAGARYIVPVAEHHDGFAMYDSAYSEWTAAKMGPKRDVIAELAAAIRQEGLVFGLSSHRAEHWFFFDGGRKFPSDVQDDRFRDLYGPAQPMPPGHLNINSGPGPEADFLADWLLRCKELVDKFQPQIFYFDWSIEHKGFETDLQQFAAYYYNRALEWGDWAKSGGAINYKNMGHAPEGMALPDGWGVFDVERGQLADIRPVFWQTDTAVQKNSWGYTENQDYKTAGSLIGDLIDIVSKNGTLLLNIGPKADGTIPEPEQAILREMGRWLAVNGEAIYGTRPWQKFGEGPTKIAAGSFTDAERPSFTSQDFRFTVGKDGALYAICLAWPESQITIHSLGAGSAVQAGSIKDVRLVGSAEKLEWSQDSEGLHIQPPAQPPCEHAYAFKISF
jgi:alpha-L-fucosidase